MKFAETQISSVSTYLVHWPGSHLMDEIQANGQDMGWWTRYGQLPLFYTILYCICVEHQKMDEIRAN